jgi:hypothetical protein
MSIAPAVTTAVWIPEVEDLFVKQEQTLDREARFDLQNQMQRAFVAVWPLEISVFPVSQEAMSNCVKDYGPIYASAFQGFKYDGIWIDQS